MEDLIACLYPYNDGLRGLANRAILLPHNAARYVPAREGLVPDMPGRHSRESTVPLDGDNDDTPDATLDANGLQLTFTHGPKAGPGFLFGTDRNSCDIVLPNVQTISRRHCYLMFDTERRLILRDCSMNGTMVQYDGRGGKQRRHFTWIIGGPGFPGECKEVIVQFDKDLKFRIMVSKPSSPQTFFRNVDQFMKDTATSAEFPFGALGMQSVTVTVAPSGTQTPRKDPILLVQRELGKGASSIVNLVWDVSTGDLFASKTILDTQQCNWKQEASLMRQISHEHVVQLHFVLEAPLPQLIMEYLPLGSLYDQSLQQPISDTEVISTLQQSLSALAYLHERAPPIVHRDIKPCNILVQSRNPFLIKLADFGLSKASHELKTMCGTMMYLAPEFAMYVGGDPASSLFRYTHAVDIWSLGVVIFEYMYGLPKSKESAGLPWCEKIVRALNDWDSDVLVELLSKMIVMNPKGRMSARGCCEVARLLDHEVDISTPESNHSQQDRTEFKTTYNSQRIFGASQSTAQGVGLQSGIRGTMKRRRSSDEGGGPHSEVSHKCVNDLLRVIRSDSDDGEAENPQCQKIALQPTNSILATVPSSQAVAQRVQVEENPAVPRPVRAESLRSETRASTRSWPSSDSDDCIDIRGRRGVTYPSELGTLGWTTPS